MIKIHQPQGGVKKGEMFKSPILDVEGEEPFNFENQTEGMDISDLNPSSSYGHDQWNYNLLDCTDDPLFFSTFLCPHGKFAKDTIFTPSNLLLTQSQPQIYMM